MKYKILLTGGDGFIGSHIQKKIDGVVYDIQNGDDIRDRFKLDRLCQKEQFDICINLAARAGVPSGETFYQEYFSTNCVGLKNVIEVCDKYKIQLIHFSSSSALEHRSVYGITKLAGELLVTNSKLNWTIIRPFTVIGEEGRKEMVLSKWKTQIEKGEKVSFYGNGKSFRGYTYVGDLINGVLMCIGNKKAFRKIFNLGGNQKVTLNELWKIFKEVYPRAERQILPFPKYDNMGSIADISLAKKVLKWQPKTDIKKKIKEIIKDYE